MKKIYFLLFYVLLLPTLKAQIPSIQWSYALTAPAFGSPSAADLDKDGKLEIVFSTYTNDGKVHCLNAENGTVNWIFDIGGCGDVAPLIIDANHDDTLDIIVNGSCNPYIYCINGLTGRELWKKYSGGGDSPPSMANMDSDSFPEILFCNFSGELYILNGEDGSTDKKYQVDMNKQPIQTEPVTVDTDKDGTLEIIIANHFGNKGMYVMAISYATGDSVWVNRLSDSSTYHAYHGGALADVDGNGDLEYIYGTNSGRVRALNIEDGSVLWQVYIPVSCMAPVSVADVNKDGVLDVVICNNDYKTFDERIWVLDGRNGKEQWSYKTTFSSFRGCAIADINGNDTLDLVAGYYMGDIIAIEPFSGLLWKMNIKNELKPGLPYFDAGNGPLVADFDGDGRAEVFIIAGYGTYTPDSLNNGKAFMIEAGNGHCPSWLMFRQDVQRSGYLSAQDIQLQCPNIGIEHVSALHTINIFPQPAGDYLNIEANANEQLVISIYDITGKIIMEKIPFQKQIYTGNIPNGFYIIKLENHEYHVTSTCIIFH